jgi:hypothetical protein
MTERIQNRLGLWPARLLADAAYDRATDAYACPASKATVQRRPTTTLRRRFRGCRALLEWCIGLHEPKGFVYVAGVEDIQTPAGKRH